MSQKKRGGTRMPPFVAMPWLVLNSKAYLELNNSSKAALPYFFGKPKVPFDRPDYYELVFSFPYAEAKRLGFPSATYFKVIRELVATGFIDPQNKGGLYSDRKVASLFTLSRRWKDFGTPNFKPLDWRTFIPKPRTK